MNYNSNNRSLIRVVLTATLLFMVMLSLHAQDSLRVSGVVVSPENKPVANVAVSVEGSREMPVLTNETGEFTVLAPTASEWLIIAPAANYKRQRLFLSGRTNLSIMISPNDLISGEDELILLLQPIRKKDMAAAFADIDMQHVHHAASLSIDQHMQGRIPGMQVISQSGAPGAGAATFLRGINSLHASNQPLYIVDGVIQEPTGLFGSVVDGFAFNPLLNINPLDISKATVMKDPVYSAAYGSKASNGLIMIQTLDPSATETSFEIDLRRGYSLKPERYIPQLNALQHKTLANELLYSSGLTEEVMLEDFPNLFLAPNDTRFNDYQHDTEWQKFIFQDAAFTNFNMEVKGGDEIARYGLSFGYYSNNGIIQNTSYDGYNLRFVSLVNIFTWLRMNATVSFKTSSANLKESAKAKETSPILASLAKSPLLYPYQYDKDGFETLFLTEVDEFGTSNPLSIIQNFEANNRNYSIISSLGFEANIGKQLLFKTNFGITYNALKEKLFMPNKGMERYYGQEAYNVAKASTNTFEGFSNNSMLIYNKKINNDHVINATTGVNVISNNFQYDWGIAKNSHENDQYRNLADGISNLREIGGVNRSWNWLSVYEKVSYAYQDKYFATGSISLDGSSRVGRNADNTLKLFGNPFGLFYSAGLAWRVSNENFLNQVSWLEDLKIRASLGRTGNDDIGESNARNYYKTIQFRETSGVYPATIPNPNLTYELVDQLNAGIDIALLGNRIRMNVDGFKNTTSNMLIYTPLKSYFGYDFRPENAATMQNSGWEAYAFFRLVNTKNFKWDIEATYSQAKNQVTEMKNDKLVSDFGSHELVNMVGAPVNSFYGYQFKGVFATAEEANAANLRNNKGVKYQAGDAIYEDISGPNNTPDGFINDYDKVPIGNTLPEFIGGITNTFRYKNWGLSAFVYFVSGNEVFNYVRYQNEKMTGFDNQSKNVLNRWQYDGQQTNVPRALWNDPIGNSAFSSRWVEDGSYIRLKNLSLSYSIPNEFLSFKNAEFYVSASNLFTFSKYLGYDPEFGNSYNLVEQGIDYGQMPHARQFMIGIKLGL